MHEIAELFGFYAIFFSFSDRNYNDYENSQVRAVNFLIME